MSETDRLTNMVGRLRAYAIVLKQADFNEAADAIEELMAALKQSHDTMHELTAIIPGNDKGAIDAIAEALRAARAAYRGEKDG